MSPTSAKPDGRGLGLRDVSAFYGPLAACRGINLFVAPGEVLGLIGPNGAGKSSLVGAIAGTVTSRGRISLGPIELQECSSHERSLLGLTTVPDNRGLFAPFTVAENLRLGAYRLPREKREGAIDAALGVFPFLQKRWKTAAGSLSGGEQQMLAIAKCLAAVPSAIVLDEPSQGLAPIILNELVGVLEKLRGIGVPILLIEQNQFLVQHGVDRYAVMVHGRITAEGPADELSDRARLAQLFLG